MASLNFCIYCNRQILNAGWHEECRTAYLEDLLARIKLSLRLKRELPSDFIDSHFRTIDETKGKKREAVAAQHEKNLKKMREEGLRAEYIKKCSEAWEHARRYLQGHAR